VIIADDMRTLKIIDFNLATNADDGMMTPIGTPAYFAPELRSPPFTYDELIDVWCAGMCLFVMLTGQSPHDACSRFEEWIPYVDRFRWDISSACLDVLRHCLKKKLADRWTAEAAYSSAWLQEPAKERSSVLSSKPWRHHPLLPL